MEEGVVVATVPALPGCVSHGRTLDEAEQYIREAIACYIEGLQQIGEAIPIEEQPAQLTLRKSLDIRASA
ncbi:type II toxin-antitoxin system HicB family antitoxin [bacterium]|nr:type II toxin-antitoxin system HicB family antitoxin [bacterium]